MTTEADLLAVLAAIPEGETWTTAQVGNALYGHPEGERWPLAQYRWLAARAEAGYATRGEPKPGRSFNTGKTVRPWLWTRRSGPVDAAPAPSTAASLADRLARIEMLLDKYGII
jgi:hypothetical protein